MAMTIQEMVEQIEEKMARKPLLAAISGSPHLRITHVHEIVNRLNELGIIINRIEGELAKPWERSGVVFQSQKEWESWRKRAKVAADWMRVEKSELKKAMKEARMKADAHSIGVFNIHDPRSMLQSCLGVLSRIGRDHGFMEMFSQEELDLLDVAREYLQSNLPMEALDFYDDVKC